MEEYLNSYKIKIEFAEKRLNETISKIEKSLLERLLIGYKFTYNYMRNKIVR